MKTLTVAQLIAELQKFPPDLPTVAQGCDCEGKVVGVSLENTSSGSSPYILILRSFESGGFDSRLL